MAVMKFYTCFSVYYPFRTHISVSNLRVMTRGIPKTFLLNASLCLYFQLLNLVDDCVDLNILYSKWVRRSFAQQPLLQDQFL